VTTEGGNVLTMRNLGGIALFLFGTTFLWLTPAFATKGVSTSGVAWSVANVGSLVTLAGFCAATWGLFTKAAWWEPVAIACAIVGLVVLVPYWIAAHTAGETNPTFTALVHVPGSVGVLVLLLIPTLERWVSGHVMSGR
jgi:hypothetical protein